MKPSRRTSASPPRAPVQPPSIKRAARPVSQDSIDRHTQRVRQICLALPGTTERLSHGEPTFFVDKRVFAMLSLDHHDDGRVAVVIPLADGVQEQLLADAPAKYFYPSYVGVRGWIGIHLTRASDKLLTQHLSQAWRLVAPKRLLKPLAAVAAASHPPRTRG